MLLILCLERCSIWYWSTRSTLMELGAGNLTGGIWGSFGLNDDASGNELDLWVSYDFGPLALTVTNYSFPGADGTYSAGGVFDGDIEVSGSTSLGPIDLTVGYFTDLEAFIHRSWIPNWPCGRSSWLR